MSRYITPTELARILTTLLVAPQAMGELDTEEKFGAFFTDAAGVVANHCGGEIREAASPEHDGEESHWYVAVHPNETLPDLVTNAWSLGDPEGVVGEPLDGKACVAAEQAYAAEHTAWLTSQTALLKLLQTPNADLSDAFSGRVQEAIPDSDGAFGQGFRHAIESLSLALAKLGIPESLLTDAAGTAIEAYGNHADLFDPETAD